MRVRSALPLALVLLACASDQSSPDGEGPPGTLAKIACTSRALVVPERDFFTDISAESGIQKDNFVPGGMYEGIPIPINDHSRIAFADIDGDGFDDIVAHSLFPNAQKGVPFDHLVFLNEGGKTFRDFSDASGLRNVQAAFFVFADVDNDGDQDCFAGLDIALPGETSALYLNDGSGHFTKKEGSGLEKAALAANAVFADFDGDAVLDLYVGNGSTMSAVRDQLFLGNGDGTFRDASSNLASRRAQPTNGVVACDYDGDGDIDVLVSHYGVSVERGWRTLWENDGYGFFRDVAVERGFHALPTGNSFLASTERGTLVQPGDPAQHVGSNGFGIDCADVDGDGLMDVWLATISHPVDADFSRKWSDPSMLLLNRGDRFEDATKRLGLPFNEGDIDAAAVDFDNDGRVDLSVTRDKKYEGSYEAPDQKAWFGLFRQKDDGTFESVGLVSGINDPTGATDRAKAGQNLAWADIDHDGDLDLLVGGRDNGGGGRANFLFENTIGSRNGWVAVRLRGDGVHVNRDAIGARVTVTAGERRWVREVKSSRGTYSSADSRLLVFGLGADGCVDGTSRVALEVRWPDGTTRKLEEGTFPLNEIVVVDYTGE